jgi:hypothetical protein
MSVYNTQRNALISSTNHAALHYAIFLHPPVTSSLLGPNIPDKLNLMWIAVFWVVTPRIFVSGLQRFGVIYGLHLHCWRELLEPQISHPQTEFLLRKLCLEWNSAACCRLSLQTHPGPLHAQASTNRDSRSFLVCFSLSFYYPSNNIAMFDNWYFLSRTYRRISWPAQYNIIQKNLVIMFPAERSQVPTNIFINDKAEGAKLSMAEGSERAHCTRVTRHLVASPLRTTDRRIQALWSY